MERKKNGFIFILKISLPFKSFVNCDRVDMIARAFVLFVCWRWRRWWWLQPVCFMQQQLSYKIQTTSTINSSTSLLSPLKYNTQTNFYVAPYSLFFRICCFFGMFLEPSELLFIVVFAENAFTKYKRNSVCVYFLIWNSFNKIFFMLLLLSLTFFSFVFLLL